MSPVELTITVKDAEGKKLTKPFLIYEKFSLDTHDPIVDKCVTEVIEEFKGEADEVKIRATMVM